MASSINALTSSGGGVVTTADSSGVLNLQSNGTTVATVSSTGLNVTGSITSSGQIAALKVGTPTSVVGLTGFDLTAIPSWATKITMAFSNLSTVGGANLFWQLGYGSTTWQTTGYSGTSGRATNGNTTDIATMNTDSFNTRNASSSSFFHGSATFYFMGSNTWLGKIEFVQSNNNICIISGFVTLSGTLTGVRLTTSSGTDTFDTGTVNTFYE